jgi:putative membrane protein
MSLFLATVALRPYVFIFLASFLFIGTVNFGARATLVFAALTYGVALTCEWSSVHNGFPFGLYHYIEATRGREVWVIGVPLMDSLSFTFLGFASYTVALLLSAPLYRDGWDLRILDTWELRRSPRLWLLAAMFMVMVDLVVDPLSVLGDRWFLGRIFWYDPPGVHFGVPISNYLGWFFVAAITIALFQTLDRWLNRGGGGQPRGLVPSIPSRALLGPLLYVGVVTFGITMLFRIRAAEIGWASIFIFLPVIALTLHILTRPESYGGAEAIDRHLRDFPYLRDSVRWPIDLADEKRTRGASETDRIQFK